MKNFLLLFALIAGFQAIAQPFVYQKGGKKQSVKYVIPDPKKTFVKVEIDGNESKIKNIEIDSIRFENQLIKPFSDGKKLRMFSVLTKIGNRELVVNKSDLIKSRGGFESIQTFYTLAVSESGTIVKTLTFSNSETEKEIANRAKAFAFVNDNFVDCPKIISHFELFRNESDAANLTILNYLNTPEYLTCK